MKKRTLITTVLLTTTAIAATLSTTTTANAQTTTTASYSDYLPTGTNAAVATTGATQCAKTVNQRSGPWLCINEEGSRTAMAAGVSHLNPIVTDCITSGCWDLVDTTHAEFYGNYVYGQGGTVLGSGTDYIKWTLTGASETQNPARFTNSRATTQSDFDGSLSNGAVGVANGGSVKSYCNEGRLGIQGAGISRSWPNGGCTLYDSTSYNHNMVAEMSWFTNGYEGRWYIFTRSPVSHANDKANFRFTSADALPGNPTGSGWTQS